MSIVQLHKATPFHEIVTTLRRIADEIERGDIEWPVTTAVLVLGHSENKPSEECELYTRDHWRTYGIGPRSDPFTCRGLLASVIHCDFQGGDG